MTFEADKTAESMEDVLPGGKLLNFLGVLAKKTKESLHPKEACTSSQARWKKKASSKSKRGLRRGMISQRRCKFMGMTSIIQLWGPVVGHGDA